MRRAMTEHLDDLLQPSKHPRLGKNAGVGGGDTDSGHHSEHGEDARRRPGVRPPADFAHGNRK